MLFWDLKASQKVVDFEVHYVSSEVQSAAERLALKLHGDFYFFDLMFVSFERLHY